VKLQYSNASPYVRKVVVTAIEAGLNDEIERVKPEASVWIGEGDLGVTAVNPLGKIPTLTTRKGVSLPDSSLICEYLSSLAPEKALLPLQGNERWEVLRHQTLAQGMMDAIIMRAAETQIRPDKYTWPEGIQRHTTKIERTLDAFEDSIVNESAHALNQDAVNLATITLACTLGYLVQRFGIEDWRQTRPHLSTWYDTFSKRASMTATAPPSIPPAHLDPRKT
jgi:glutathione S-transferase